MRLKDAGFCLDGKCSKLKPHFLKQAPQYLLLVKAPNVR